METATKTRQYNAPERPAQEMLAVACVCGEETRKFTRKAVFDGRTHFTCERKKCI